jgi:chitin deacetylase
VANRHLFAWQRSLSIALVVAVLGFVAGFGWRVDHSTNQKTVLPVSLRMQQDKAGLQTLNAKAVTAQQDAAHQKAGAKLAQEEKVKRLNASIPVQFQGKTIREINLKVKDNSKTKLKQTNAIAPSTPPKLIALTFDDGPWPQTTSKVLAVLKKQNVKATFFVVGKQVEQHPQLVKQAVAEGHAIGNHSWSHQYHHYSSSAAAHELDKTAALVHKLTGVKTSLFRPPAGILNNGLVASAQQKKYAVVMWSIDSKDWRSGRTTKQALVDNLLKEAKSGGIVLLHDGGGDRSKTIEALPQLITQLKKHGYTFVTVPELLEKGVSF